MESKAEINHCKKRIAIMSVYDSEKKWRSYRSYLMKELSRISEEIYVVINGEIKDMDDNLIDRTKIKIVFRENMGYDGGAYREILTRYIGLEKLKLFDELILCNDTFFGPFIPFEDIFSAMDERNTDFWGIHYVKNILRTHIESFFYVFRNREGLFDVIYKYFLTHVQSNAAKINDLYILFEQGIYDELISKGYAGKGYVEDNPHSLYSNGDIAMSEYNMPLLKKKFFRNCKNKENLIHALKYVMEQTNYDVNRILECVDLSAYGIKNKIDIEKYDIDESKLDKNRSLECRITSNDLLEYIDNSDSIYLYGAGGWGTVVFDCYVRNTNKCRGFLVSVCKKEHTLYDVPIIKYSKKFDEEYVIVALSEANTRELVKQMGHKKKWLYLW